MKHVLMVISGPSGVGKGTIVKALKQRRADVVESISCTTRAPRNGETHGKEYFFLSKEEFLRRIDAQDFLEYDAHFDNYYGTPKSFVYETLKTKSVILEIDVVGALKVKKVCPESVLVMIAPPSKEELKKRLEGRESETAEQIQGRLARLEYELSMQDKYDYVVINDELEKAISEVERILDESARLA